MPLKIDSQVLITKIKVCIGSEDEIIRCGRKSIDELPMCDKKNKPLVASSLSFRFFYFYLFVFFTFGTAAIKKSETYNNNVVKDSPE